MSNFEKMGGEILFCALSLFLFIKIIGADEIKTYQATRVDSPPNIDGVLDDSCWKKAEKKTDFVKVITGTGLAEQQTFFAILHDDKNLYFGIECEESAIKELKQNVTVHDAEKTSADDCVEIFIDTNFDKATYYQFIITSSGITYEGRLKDRNWDAEWQAKTKIGDKRWSVEVAIPFSSLADPLLHKVKPEEGDLWGLNINRERWAAGSEEYSCWSDTGGGFHAPARFGQLVFGSYGTYIAGNILPLLKDLGKEISQLLTSNKRIKKQFGERFTKLTESIETIEKRSVKKDCISREEITALQEALKKLENLRYEIKFALLLEE